MFCFFSFLKGARSPEEKCRAHDWNNVKTVLGALNVGALILGGLVLVIEEAKRHLQAILRKFFFSFFFLCVVEF